MIPGRLSWQDEGLPVEGTNEVALFVKRRSDLAGAFFC